MVTFIFSNPNHHLDMMGPVAARLYARGIACRMISLAELRGLRTPDLAARLPGIAITRAVPPVRKQASSGAGLGTGEGPGSIVRNLVRATLWAALRVRLELLLRGTDVAVIPNDVAYPYDRIAALLRARGIPFALLQEGIRFPLPTENRAGAPYGSSGATTLCAWGEASARHFRGVGARDVLVTGNPRFDSIDPDAWRTKGRELAARLGLAREPLVYLSNTIDDQGFCTTDEKLALFSRFVRAAGPVAARDGREIVVKLHPRESVAAFRAAAAAIAGVRVHVVEGESLFAVLAMAKAAVVLASTAGLEALAFDVPLGVLELPRHGHVFDYVSSGAAIGLCLDELEAGVARLLGGDHDPAPGRAFLESHMANRGVAVERVADCLVRLSRGISA